MWEGMWPTMPCWPFSTRRMATVITCAPLLAQTSGMRASLLYLPVPMNRRLCSSTPPMMRGSLF